MFHQQRVLTKVRQDVQAMAAAMAGMFKDVVKGDIEKGVDKFGKALSSAGISAHLGPVAVFISGATGGNAAKVNGLFEPSEEKSSDGRVVYKKRDDASIVVEHFTGDWEVKPASNKGKAGCFALVKGGCALEACVGRVWRVVESGAFHDQKDVKMSTGAEAEAQASSVDARAHTPAQIFLAPPSARSAARGVPSYALCFFLPTGGRTLCRPCACCC